MKELLKNVDWKKVATVAGCVLTGVIACVSAFSEQKQANKIIELETRVASLEPKN